MTKNRFIIRRSDRVEGADEMIVESEGLTIGRTLGNDLPLNNRAVSRTHAGIKKIASDFWIFNLSETNGTLLNGELVNKTPLADGDVIQIGPYTLQAAYDGDALALNVDMDISIQPEGTGPIPTLAADAGAAATTLLVRMPVKKTVTPGGTQRLQGTGLLTGMLPALDQQALDSFWEKRKREAGKIGGQTPLHPKGGKRYGKAQWNWRPTLDLSRIWRKSYFMWGAIITVALAAAAVFVYEKAYSPGPISDPHTRAMDANSLLTRNIASQPNQESCSTCHGVVTGMYDKCIGCHKTGAVAATATAPAKSAFLPQSLIDGHINARVTACTDCHTEHQGAASSNGLLDYRLCNNCHNNKYTIEAGPNAGKILRIPHGGTVGYPLENDQWTFKGWTAARWQRALDRWESKELIQQGVTAQQLAARPDSQETDIPRNQFHRIHYLGKRYDDAACVVCHYTREGILDSTFKLDSTRRACARCHTVNYDTTGVEPANCTTCHKQHPVGDAQSVPGAQVAGTQGQDLRGLNKFLAAVENTPGGVRGNPDNAPGLGGGDVIRQNRDALDLRRPTNFGALPWYVWVGLIAILPLAGLFVMLAGSARRKGYLKTAQVEVERDDLGVTGSLDIEKLKAEGPSYPHPVINVDTCIGCHACVDACPHDVLAIVNNKATVVAMDQCMEDTSCQVECPTNPKSCLVINTAKKIPPRKVPARDQRLKTNVDGVYMIGDVSGTPLIKNAINEGRLCIDSIREDLQREGRTANAEYDVAVIGVGPAGLSAAVLAKKEGLSYVALEQDKIAATIQTTYQAGKFVFFTPPEKQVVGGIPLPGPGNTKENMLQGWFDAMMSNGVVINQEEGCKEIKQENGVFVIHSEEGKLKEKKTYRARKIILAIGNRGTPMRLGVPGEDLQITIQALANHCPKCGQARSGNQQFCVKCGQQLPVKEARDSRVQYKLSDPKDYVGKKCVVVGAGNSAIEVAVGLTGYRKDGERFGFDNGAEVTLIVRSDFKGDLNLGNKMAVYDCIDSGRIKPFFGCTIREITAGEVVIMHARTKEEKARVQNDYVFALIGGEKPTKFLEGIGVKIGAENK